MLEHVRRIAEAGFARHHRFVELYDPSLPEVEGDRDRLVQVFLNLVKNAAEAHPPKAGRVGKVRQEPEDRRALHQRRGCSHDAWRSLGGGGREDKDRRCR